MKIKVEDIIEQIGLHIQPDQIRYFCSDLKLINKIITKPSKVV